MKEITSIHKTIEEKAYFEKIYTIIKKLLDKNSDYYAIETLVFSVEDFKLTKQIINNINKAFKNLYKNHLERIYCGITKTTNLIKTDKCWKIEINCLCIKIKQNLNILNPTNLLLEEEWKKEINKETNNLLLTNITRTNKNIKDSIKEIINKKFITLKEAYTELELENIRESLKNIHKITNYGCIKFHLNNLNKENKIEIPTEKKEYLMKIYDCRKANKETQEEIAKKLKITRATFANYETGITEPPIEILIKIADYFGVSLDYLCGRPFKNQIELEPYQREIYNLLPTLTKEQCSAILSMINAFNVQTTQEDLLTAQLIKKYGDK